MGKSESGPDLRDCSILGAEIQSLAGVSLTILMELDGSHAASYWLSHVLAVKKGTIEPDRLSAASVAFRWPNERHTTFEAALYDALWKIDNLLVATERGGST